MMQDGFLRLNQIIGDRSRGIPALIPISRSSWWHGVKNGKFPKPIKISSRCTAWKARDIFELIRSIETSS